MMRAAFLASGFIAAAVFLAACDAPPEKKEEGFFLKPVPFDGLPGWQADDLVQTQEALRISCLRILPRAADAVFSRAAPWAGVMDDWQVPCAALPQDDTGVQALDRDMARQYFETYFTPYEIWADPQEPQSREGLFTGYYEPQLTAVAPDAPPEEGAPLYAMPEDLVTVDLGDFRESLKGETIIGRVNDRKKLVPYPSRAEIVSGASGAALSEIVRVTDPIEAFFLHIQGSGQVMLQDGNILRVGYAGQNGHPYFAIGRELIRRGDLTSETVSMQTIRAWLEEHPDAAAEVMNLNPSFIFFRVLEESGPLGAEGVVLTPGRSLAVDRRKLPYGAPVFIDVAAPEGEERLQRLMVAQDTGGAIRGTVRGDFFWGAGDEAAHKAGLMKSRGTAWLLLPKTVTPPAEVLWRLPPKPWYVFW